MKFMAISQYSSLEINKFKLIIKRLIVKLKNKVNFHSFGLRILQEFTFSLKLSLVLPRFM
jgi:hypothetical protein